MALPSYSDLGKNCKDLFSKGYHFNKLNVSTKQRTCHGIEINTNINHSLEEKKNILADIQSKYNWPSYGIGCVTKWNLEDICSKEVTCQDYLARGLKVGMEMRCNVRTGTKGGVLMGQYKVDNATVDLSVEGGDESNLLVNSSIVGGFKNFLLGYQMGYDTNDGVLNKNNLIFGYLGTGFSSMINLDNMENVSASYYQQVDGKLETGIIGTVKGEAGPEIAIATKYELDPSGVALRAKVDNRSMLGIGAQVKIADGVTLFLSGNIDIKNFKAGGHQAGIGLEFQ